MEPSEVMRFKGLPSHLARPHPPDLQCNKVTHRVWSTLLRIIVRADLIALYINKFIIQDIIRSIKIVLNKIANALI
jgi:hypothetical protein